MWWDSATRIFRNSRSCTSAAPQTAFRDWRSSAGTHCAKWSPTSPRRPPIPSGPPPPPSPAPTASPSPLRTTRSQTASISSSISPWSPARVRTASSPSRTGRKPSGPGMWSTARACIPPSWPQSSGNMTSPSPSRPGAGNISSSTRPSAIWRIPPSSSVPPTGARAFSCPPRWMAT